VHRRPLPFALALALIALDQATKSWVVAEVAIGERAASWLGFFHLTHTRNTGAAFGLLRDLRLDLGFTIIDGVQVLGIVSLLVATAIVVVLRRPVRMDRLTVVALGTLLGGAVGNGIDRLRLGYVTDFVQMQAGWFDFPVYNVADVAIVVGAGLLVLSTLLHPAATATVPATPVELPTADPAADPDTGSSADRPADAPAEAPARTPKP
jgi:signal peptidase II